MAEWEGTGYTGLLDAAMEMSVRPTHEGLGTAYCPEARDKRDLKDGKDLKEGALHDGLMLRQRSCASPEE
jgi:hypothetical protein